MTKQNHSNTAIDTTLSAGIDGVTGTIPVVALTGWPSVPFFAVIDPGSATDEEVVYVTNVVGTTLTATRHADGTTAKPHTLGAVVRFCAVAFDLEGWVLGGQEVSAVAPVSGDSYVYNGTLWVPTAVVPSSTLTESVQDIVGAFVTAPQQSMLAFTYSDVGNTLTLDRRDLWNGFDWIETFMGGLGGWSSGQSGTGATLSLTTSSDGAHPGLASPNCGTDTTGIGAIQINSSTLVTMVFGSGTWLCQAIVRIPTLSDGTNTYRAWIGFKDIRAGAGTDCVFITYNHTENSGKFSAECRSNGTSTTADLGVTVAAATFYRFEISVNAAGTSVVFNIYDDTTGSLLGTATITTNIPNTSSRLTSPSIGLEKSAGTTARTLDIDCTRYRFVRT